MEETIMADRSVHAKHSFPYPLLGFLIPFLGMLAVTLTKVCQGLPDTQYSMLCGDMYHQYYPFFALFRRTLLEGKSLFYTWEVGMGADYLGLIAYYLASPLNLFSVLVPEHLVLSYFTLLAPLKLGFAGLFFSIFLKHIFEKNDFSVSVFGSFYALCAWAIGYHWNVMWLDTFALLPLVVLGFARLLKSRKCTLYTVTLFFSIYANYYIGFFTCLFIFLLFFCYEFCHFRSSSLWSC